MVRLQFFQLFYHHLGRSTNFLRHHILVDFHEISQNSRQTPEHELDKFPILWVVDLKTINIILRSLYHHL